MGERLVDQEALFHCRPLRGILSLQPSFSQLRSLEDSPMRLLASAFTIAILCLVPQARAQRFSALPDVPSTTPDPKYPVHLHLVMNHYNHVNGSYEGYGRGNILGNPMRGFDYTFNCTEPFLRTAQPDEFYQARWKKQDAKLELLMLKVGSNHTQHCDLNVAIKPVPYRTSADAPAPAPASSAQ
jgi:hypothetical protein